MPPKNSKKRYSLAPHFPKGFTVIDNLKKRWFLDDSVGQGGFGLIYSAIQEVKTSDNEYVIKIEPKDNGPLFCEQHFYGDCAKEADILSFMESRGLWHLAIPKRVSYGLFDYQGESYRFLVMHRYQRDLQTVLDNNYNNQLAENIVLYLLRQIFYALEYIHSRGYTHADIKGSNLMFQSDREVCVVDFGLARRFARDGVHFDYVEKPKNRHDGTIEYTSRDAHSGVPSSRRSDIEIVLYCCIHWLCGTLPWINDLDKPDVVQSIKINYMNDVKNFIRFTSLKTQINISDKVLSFFEYLMNHVNSLDYKDEPNYYEIQKKINETLRYCNYPIQDDFGNIEIQKPVKTLKSLNLKNEFKSPTEVKKMYYTDNLLDYDLMTSDDEYSDQATNATNLSPFGLASGYMTRSKTSTNDNCLNRDEKKTPKKLTKAEQERLKKAEVKERLHEYLARMSGNNS